MIKYYATLKKNQHDQSYFYQQNLYSNITNLQNY